MILHPKQQAIVKSDARFKVVRSGRRSGKSTYAIEEMCFTAVSGKDRNIFYTAPTMIQARNIIWEALKSRLAGIAEVNEARLEMKVPTIDGGTSIIYVKGWENRENFRGMKAHLEVFDELDTMKDFFIGWQEIFRPALTDTRGKAIFIGTPKKENPNLRRLEKEAKADWECFHFKTEDNPHIPKDEIEKAKDEIDYETYKQEYLAEYVDHSGSLFNYLSLVDVFSNSVTKDNNKFLIVDVADDGGDKTIFSRWESLEEVAREEFKGINTEQIIAKIREYAQEHQIPYSNIAVDAIGVGAGVASSSMLNGIVGYKSSFAPIKTDLDIVRLPNVHYTKDASLTSDYKNLRSQCVFTLSDLVNNHKIASRLSGQFKERIIEELSVYQDASTGDGKRMATQKDDVKALIGRSPDHCFIAGTMVLTDKGEKRIENIRIGDNVVTPFGIRKVVRAGKTHTDVTVDMVLMSNGRSLVATQGHKVYVNNGIRTLDTLVIGDKLESYNIINLIKWRILNTLNLMKENIGFRQTVDTTMQQSTTEQVKSVEKEKLYIVLYGSIITTNKFLKVLLSTTLMEIITIIILKILYFPNLVSIVLTTQKKKLKMNHLEEDSLITSTQLGYQRQNGTAVKRVKNGTLKMARVLGVKENNILKLVYRVVVNIKLIIQRPLSPVVLDVFKDCQRADVYNLTVDKDNVYYANGVLVSNSDTWVMRMYFVIRNKMSPDQSEERTLLIQKMHSQMAMNRAGDRSTK